MKTAFITGANRGLGLELVKQYAQRGWRVIACCRDINTAQALLNNILAGEDKTIIGMTSKLASIDDNRSGGRYSYRASKAALNQIIKSLACELSEVGVKTMAIHPGWVQTDMGGKDGKVTVEECVKGMLNVIDNLKLKHSGSFFVYDGTQLPW